MKFPVERSLCFHIKVSRVHPSSPLEHANIEQFRIDKNR